MNGTSLNQSITAAWGTSSSGGASAAAGPSTAPLSAPAPSGANGAIKRKVKRSTNLNSQPLDSGASTPDGERASTPRRKRPRQEVGAIPSKYAPPDLKLGSLGGLRPQITQLLEIVVLPLLHPEIYQFTGVPRPRGVLLHGVPGGGKTQLVKCLAGVCPCSTDVRGC